MNTNLFGINPDDIDLHKHNKEHKRKYKKTLDKQFKMNLDDKMEMLRMSIRAVTRGYKFSRLITGCLEANTRIDLLVSDEIYKKIINNREK